MSKRNEKTIEAANQKENKSSGFFQKLLLWVVIPLLFASALLLIIAKFADLNVFDKMNELTNKLPFIGEKHDEDDSFDQLVLEDRVVALQAEIQDKEVQVSQLEQQLEASEDEKVELLLERERLQEEMVALKSEGESARQEFKEIVTTFEKMSAKAAAPILINMEDADAIQILTNLKPDKVAEVLEKMPAEEAAKYASILSK